MPPKGATVTPVPQSLVARATAALGGAIRGAADAWFAPQQPVGPTNQEQAEGRLWDYSTGYNLPIIPRSEPGNAGVSFAMLRALADPGQGGFDLVRLAIETRKDQMAGQKWTIKGRDGTDGGDKARGIEKLFRRPDGSHTFMVWQRMLMEDLLVIDEPTVFLSPGAGKQRVPKVMDGALLKKLITPEGDTPLPPEPAYQQVVKGVPAAVYSTNDVVCMSRNLRPAHVYGYSPVEQLLVTINIALRRQVSQLEYYTAGSIPDMLASVPPSWSTKQIGEFQAYWDTLMSGNTEERRRLRFVPGEMKPYEPKAGQLKDTYDEWLARLVCYCFSISPQALVAQMNRATAQTAQEQSLAEGLEPLKLWWKDFADEVLEKAFAADYLEFAYVDEEISDPTVKIAVFTGLKQANIITADEARKAYGMDPLTPQQKDELAPPPPPMLAPPEPGDKKKPDKQLALPLDGAPAGDEAETAKLAKAAGRAAGRLLQADQTRPPGHAQGCRCHQVRYP